MIGGGGGGSGFDAVGGGAVMGGSGIKTEDERSEEAANEVPTGGPHESTPEVSLASES